MLAGQTWEQPVWGSSTLIIRGKGDNSGLTSAPLEQVRRFAALRNHLGARTNPDVQAIPMPGQPEPVGISWVLRPPPRQ